MADVLNRTTKEYLTSQNTPDFDVLDWIINPDLSGVVGVPIRYWKIVGDVVSEMTKPEKDAVDAALAAAQEIFLAIGEQPAGVFETSSNEYQPVLVLDPENPLTPGDYRLDWQAQVKRTSNRATVNIRIDFDGVEVLTLEGVDAVKWLQQSGGTFITVTGDHTVTLLAASSSNGRTIQVRSAQLAISAI